MSLETVLVVGATGHVGPKFVTALGTMSLDLRHGRYVADAALHEALLGPLPTKDDGVRRWAQAQGLVQTAPPGVR